LETYLERKLRYKNELITFSKKKIRIQDVGRQRDFDRLLKEYEELYERKKTEEVEYNAACEEKAKKRPHISNTGGIIRFSRMESKERNERNNDGNL
jgi:predicted methyltransferase MtxX (methanogen marker protein 4)